MKQVIQNPKTGTLELLEVPAPSPERGQVLVRNAFSVLSPGTEKLAMDFARKSMIDKARSRPDLVKQVVDKVRNEGPLPTYRTVMNRLDVPQPLGYASAGVVVETGSRVASIRPGDRVACAGAGYANHAEYVVVPENLVARVPDGLELERAAFATLGAISLQGIRIGDPKLGEIVAVIGLGLIGQLAVQLLLASGCRVYGVDLDPRRVSQARSLGMDWGASPGDDHRSFIQNEANGYGVDLSIIAAGSDSSAPVQLGAELCRSRGRLVVVGATAMNLERRVFYEKELELRMSMSYGPGRYDRRYEEQGLDYPLPHVRWTERRNLEAFLALASRGSIDPMRMEVDTVRFEAAIESYEELARGNRQSVGAVFQYSEGAEQERTLSMNGTGKKIERQSGQVAVAMIGAGNYSKAVLLPAIEKIPNVARRLIVTSTGASAQRAADRFEFSSCGTDPRRAVEGDDIDFIFIATRHDSHADLAESALRAGKGVWIEKPVGLGPEEVDAVARAAIDSGGFLTVGYNRRFSSHARAVRESFAERRGPMAVQYVIAAGPTPAGTWITDPDAGGGRIVGEFCHFVDLCTFLVGELPSSVFAHGLGRDPDRDDSVMALISFPDGSTASISYLANAGAALPKERWEVHADGRSAICENFKISQLPNGRKLRGMNQDKGQNAAIEQELTSWSKGSPPGMSLSEIVSVSRVTFAIEESISRGARVPVDPWKG